VSKQESDGGAAALSETVSAWIASHSNWQWQSDPDPSNNDYMAELVGAPAIRRSDLDEVVASLLDDQRVQAVLSALTSPVGVALEQAVLDQYLSPVDAQLLTEALGAALKIVKDKRKPPWLRTEVLVGVGVVALSLGYVIVSSRRSGS
jgi:hypothetical protein